MSIWSTLCVYFNSDPTVPTNDLVPPIRQVRKHHSLVFQTSFANTDIYNCSSSPRLLECKKKSLPAHLEEEVSTIYSPTAKRSFSHILPYSKKKFLPYPAKLQEEDSPLYGPTASTRFSHVLPNCKKKCLPYPAELQAEDSPICCPTERGRFSHVLPNCKKKVLPNTT